MNNLEQSYKKILEVLSKFSGKKLQNYQRRKLFPYIKQIRTKIAQHFNEFEDVFMVDSMPLKVCENSRAKRSHICKEFDYSSPDFGYCASQKLYYYGYKLHAICSLNGIFQSIDMSPASVHDIRYLNDVKEQLSNCTLIGDKGYLSAEVQIDLFNYANIQLDTPKRTNQKDYRPQFRLFRKKRKRIETLFSQLCDQFMIKCNYVKSFKGFKIRIFSKITSLTLIQYINKFILNREIHNLKASII